MSVTIGRAENGRARELPSRCLSYTQQSVSIGLAIATTGPDRPMSPRRRFPGLSSLRAFEAAARHLSFSRAADELLITQSAVSHHVRKVEEDLGVSLFVR